ncbi:hypothetical protein P2P35_21935 [Escherichia coli]
MALAHKAQGYDVADVERPARERWVTMSNALTRAGHGLTLAEKRIVAAAVSKLGSRRVLKPGEVPRTKITAAGTRCAHAGYFRAKVRSALVVALSR